jgi:RNA polymerase sigma-70 factor, ECF subfamily
MTSSGCGGYHDIDESTLLEIARAGDQQAFGALIERHRAGLAQFCCLMIADPTLAEHAAQEAVLSAWCERGAASASVSVRMWLYRIALRACGELEAPAMSFGAAERLTGEHP